MAAGAGLVPGLWEREGQAGLEVRLLPWACSGARQRGDIGSAITRWWQERGDSPVGWLESKCWQRDLVLAAGIWCWQQEQGRGCSRGPFPSEATGVPGLSQKLGWAAAAETDPSSLGSWHGEGCPSCQILTLLSGITFLGTSPSRSGSVRTLQEHKPVSEVVRSWQHLQTD